MSPLFVALYGYAVAERICELFISRRNRHAMAEVGFGQREPSSALVLMVALHVSWLIVTPVEASFFAAPLPDVLTTGAASIFLLAQALRVWTLKTLGSFWNISVMTQGFRQHGFVSAGPYRFIRHPNYLVVIAEIASLPLVGGAIVSSLLFSLLNAAVLSQRIAVEERWLETIPGYKDTMGSKGRFLPSRARH